MKYDKEQIKELLKFGAHIVRLSDKKPIVKKWLQVRESDETILNWLPKGYIGIVPSSLKLCCVDVDNGGSAMAREVMSFCGKPLAGYKSSTNDRGEPKFHMLYRQPKKEMSKGKFAKANDIICSGGQMRVKPDRIEAWLRAARDAPLTDPLNLNALPQDDSGTPTGEPWAHGNRHSTLLSRAAKICLTKGSDSKMLDKLKARAEEAGLPAAEIERTLQDAQAWSDEHRDEFDESNPLNNIDTMGLIISTRHMYDGLWYDRLEDGLWVKADELNSRRRKLVRKLCSEILKMRSLSLYRTFFTDVESELMVKEGAFDRDPNLVGLPGGEVIDLHNGVRRRVSEEERITVRLGVDPSDEDGEPPLRWLHFLEEVLPPDSIEWMQRWLGYCLTGSTAEQKFLFLYGEGANGKTTLLNVIADIMAKTAKTISARGLASGNNEHPQWLAGLKGVRLAIVNELPSNGKWNVDVLKDLTGGGIVAARLMYQNEFSFHSNCKIIASGNEKPELGRVDEAIRRRLVIAPLNSVAAGRRDKDLGDKLKDEYSEILRWMVQGAIAWNKHGLGPLPKSFATETDDYFANEDNLSGFLDRFRSGSEASFLSNDIIREIYADETGAYGVDVRIVPLIDSIKSHIKTPVIRGKKRIDGKLKRGIFGVILAD